MANKPTTFTKSPSRLLWSSWHRKRCHPPTAVATKRSIRTWATGLATKSCHGKWSDGILHRLQDVIYHELTWISCFWRLKMLRRFPIWRILRLLEDVLYESKSELYSQNRTIKTETWARPRTWGGAIVEYCSLLLESTSLNCKLVCFDSSNYGYPKWSIYGIFTNMYCTPKTHLNADR